MIGDAPNVSATTREAALRGWWDGLTTHARSNAHTAALEGAYLPDGLLRELIAAGVIVVAGGFVPYPAGGFPMPGDVCMFILAQSLPPDLGVPTPPSDSPLASGVR